MRLGTAEKYKVNLKHKHTGKKKTPFIVLYILIMAHFTLKKSFMTPNSSIELHRHNEHLRLHMLCTNIKGANFTVGECLVQ